MEDMEFILLSKLEKISSSQWLWIVAATVMVGAMALWIVRDRSSESKKAVKVTAISSLCLVGVTFLTEMVLLLVTGAEDASAFPLWLKYLFPALGLIGVVVLFVLGLARLAPAQTAAAQKLDTRALTYGALCICISFILSYIKVFSAPQGGSVTLASMLPMLWYSNRYGWKKGILAGLAYGLLQFIQKPEIVHWAQVIIDYPLAFGALGLAGVVKPLPVGIVIGCAARLLMHTLSGAIFFSEVLNADAWWFSFVYNGWYMLFETVISVVLSFPLQAVLKRYKLA